MYLPCTACWVRRELARSLSCTPDESGPIPLLNVRRAHFHRLAVAVAVQFQLELQLHFNVGFSEHGKKRKEKKPSLLQLARQYPKPNPTPPFSGPPALLPLHPFLRPPRR